MPKVTVGRIDRINLDENTIRVRIDRNTPLGNPIRVDEAVTRKEAIEAYRGYFNYTIKKRSSELHKKIHSILKILDEWHDVELTCWCSPKACHGDVIKEYLDKRICQR